MPVNFDLNDLYAFRALVEYGNFRVAAESICLSQSALSRRIEKLEAALGNRLFDRTTRRVTLTLYGQNFAITFTYNHLTHTVLTTPRVTAKKSVFRFVTGARICHRGLKA